MRLLSVIGARPQFVKAAVVCRAVAEAGATHRLVHSGQHYDEAMSDVFFRQLGLQAPDYHLGVGSASHAAQTAEMMKRLEPVLEAERPDWLILYGDTNTTLAAALVAAKLGIRSAHVEAGLRSGTRQMPEEVNRIVADHLGDVLFCPTAAAMENLSREGLADRAALTGDVMLDAVLEFREAAERQGGPLAAAYAPDAFALATVHRAANTDDPGRLRTILDTLEKIAAGVCPVLLPLHPRTAAKLKEINWRPQALTLLPPVSYFEMLLLEGRARFILTDSGGVQKEAYFFRKPCITLRDETEWVETLENRCNVLTGADAVRIDEAVSNVGGAGPWTAAYGDGTAGRRMAAMLLRGF